MTWSIVAKDPSSDAFGIAVASCFFAVGAMCPYMRSGAGAVSSQSLVNPYLGVWGLRLLESAVPAPTAIDGVVATDPGRATRQIHAVDPQGRTGAWTGSDCVPWAGHLADEAVSVAGNMLAGPAVVEDTLATYLEHADKPFAERLLRAMDAGERAGGDKRGRQGAALRIVSTEAYPGPGSAGRRSRRCRGGAVAALRGCPRSLSRVREADADPHRPRRHLPIRRAQLRARATTGDAGEAGLLGVLEESRAAVARKVHRPPAADADLLRALPPPSRKLKARIGEICGLVADTADQGNPWRNPRPLTRGGTSG